MILYMPLVSLSNCSCNLSLSSGVQYPRSSQRYNILLTSEQLPLAIFKYLINTASELYSEPSAILFIMETAARWIWSLKPKSRLSLKR